MARYRTLLELAALFARLSLVGFGGPAAHIALMEDECVRRRRWLSREELLDLLGATQLIPGPNSTELAMHIGHRRAGLPGLVVAGCAFIAPAALVVGALAAVYARTRGLPAADALLYGVKPVVVVIVARALLGFAAAFHGRPQAWAVAAAAAGAAAWGVHELAVLLGGGLAGLALSGRARRAAPAAGEPDHGPAAPGAPDARPTPAGPSSDARSRTTAAPPGGERLPAAAPPAAAPVAMGAALAASHAAPTPAALFWTFLKIGSVLYGSGYVLLAFLRADFVVRTGWLDEPTLLDAVAVGQVTPGPVFTTATFVGYLLAGTAGAVAATVGIFLPAFVFSALSASLVPRLRASARAGAFLDGVNAASLALMTVVTVTLARSAVVDLPAAAVAGAAALALWRTRVNPSWLILAGGAAGLLLAR